MRLYLCQQPLIGEGDREVAQALATPNDVVLPVIGFECSIGAGHVGPVPSDECGLACDYFQFGVF